MATRPQVIHLTRVSPESLSQETQGRIIELLRHAEKDIQTLDRMIWRILRTGTHNPTQLLKEREDGATYISMLRRAASTLNRVPPEVLGRIFVHYVGGRVFIPPNPTANPWKLGHVSSYWRKVLWNTPEVWKTIEIQQTVEYPITDTYPFEKLIDVRSAVEDIFSRNTSHSVIVKDHTFTPIADLISPKNKHITSLSLDNLSTGVLFSFADMPEESWDCLETLDLQLRDDFIPPLIQRSSFQVAPKLTVVSIMLKYRSRKPEKLLPIVLLFPWPQLTHLTISQLPVPWGAAHRILAQCATITYCDLTIIHEDDSILTSSIIALTKLESFEVAQYGTLDWTTFLKPFILPALKHMTMLPGDRIHPNHNILFVDPMISPDAITQLVLRSNCRLETLSIGGGLEFNPNLPVVDVDIETLLHSSPTLRSLKGSFILPSSAFSPMKIGIPGLSQLECIVLRLRTHGLRKFLDLIESHTVYHPDQDTYFYSGSIKHAVVWCNGSPKAIAVYRRYQKRAWTYLQAGADILVHLEDRDGEVSDGGEDDEEDSDNDDNDGDDVSEGYRTADEEATGTAEWLPNYIGQLLSSVV